MQAIHIHIIKHFVLFALNIYNPIYYVPCSVLGYHILCHASKVNTTYTEPESKEMLIGKI